MVIWLHGSMTLWLCAYMATWLCRSLPVWLRGHFDCKRCLLKMRVDSWSRRARTKGLSSRRARTKADIRMERVCYAVRGNGGDVYAILTNPHAILTSLNHFCVICYPLENLHRLLEVVKFCLERFYKTDRAGQSLTHGVKLWPHYWELSKNSCSRM